MPRGYYDNGWVIVPEVQNLSIEYLSHKPKSRNWFCIRCQRTMKAYPVDKNKPAEGWFCDLCDKKVTFKQRNQVYREVIAQVKQRYNLKTLTRQDGYWNIQSNEWTSIDGSRHNSKRRRLTADERWDIKFDVLDSLQDKLGVHISDIELDSYWQY